MPTITLKLDRQSAVTICESISAMKGEGNYKAAREQIQRAIFKAWPEILDAAAVTPPETLRDVEFNPKQQRSIAEGILHLCNSPDTSGAEFAALRKMAETLKVWPWVEFYLASKPVEDYDFPLMGEPPVTNVEVADSSDQK